MAEALWNHLGAGEWEAVSAGSNPAGYVHPLAVAAMQELDIDIRSATSKHVDQFQDEDFDLVVTVCDHAQQACPVFPRAQATLHWPFEDPAEFSGDEMLKAAGFARVRNQIAERIAGYLKTGV